MPSKRTKVHPGPFNGGEPFGEAKGDEEENSRHSSLGSPSESEPSSADEAGRLFDFAVSMVNAATVAVAPPRAAPGQAVGNDGLGQQEETGARVETGTDAEQTEGETGGDNDDGSDSSSKNSAGKLFDYAISMAAASTTAVAPPRPQREAGRKDAPGGEQEGPEKESGTEGGSGGEETQQEEEDGFLGGGAGRPYDYAVSMVAGSTTVDAPPRQESDTKRTEEISGGAEGVEEHAGAKEEAAQEEAEEDGEPQREEDDEPLGWLFDYAVSQAGLPTTEEADGQGD